MQGIYLDKDEISIQNMVLLFIAILFFSAQICNAAEHTYVQRQGSKEIKLVWSLQKSDENIIIRSQTPAKQFKNLCKPNGNTIKWSFKKENTDIKAIRKDNTIHFQGIRKGKKFKKIEEIDSAPWFQPLSYSLRALLNSQKDETRFWMISPDTLKIHKLFAQKSDHEQIRINDKLVETTAVNVSLNKFISTFWKGTYWFKEQDKLFVKFQGKKGLFSKTVKIKLVK